MRATFRAYHTLLGLITVSSAEHKAPRYELPQWCRRYQAPPYGIWSSGRPGACVVLHVTRRYIASYGRVVGGWCNGEDVAASGCVLFCLLPSVGKQQEKPRKLGTIVGNMAHIRRRYTVGTVCNARPLLYVTVVKIRLGRSVYGCETRRLTLTDRSVAIGAPIVVCSLRVTGSPVARTAQGADHVARTHTHTHTHTHTLSWTLFKVTQSCLVMHCCKANLANVSVSPHNQI
jgi:hypothetical protein